jgi:type I restriction enzyme S subunit
MSKPTKLPEGWKLVSLGEVGTLINGDRGKNYPSQKDFVDNGVPFINAGHIQNGEIDFESMNFISRKRFDLLGSGKVKSGDILYCLRGSLGKTAIIKDIQEGAIASSLVIIRPSEQIRTDYFYRYLASPIGQAEIYKYDNGSSQPNLSAQSLKQYQLPLPPLEEQRRIAAILDKADGVRRKRKEAIRLTEELLKSTFLEMFGDPVTNPKGWEVIGLGKISQIQGGLQVTPARKELPLEVPYLRVANVYRDKLLLDEIKNIRVTSSELERINMKAGDILIVEGHGNKEEIGRSSVWDGSIENCVHQNHLIRVRLDPNKAEPIYISAYLNSAGGRCQLTKFGKTTSGLNTISTSNVKATKVLCPPIEMQKRYLDFQRKLTEAKNASVQHLEQSENLFNSLLQRAFRGEL